MTMRVDGSRIPFTGRNSRIPFAVLPLTLFLWIAFTAARGTILALELFGIPLAHDPPRDFSTPQMVQAALAVYIMVLSTSLLARTVWPAATLPATFATGGIILAAASVSTGSVAAVAIVAGLFVLAWLVGDAMLRRLPPTADALVVRVPLSIGLGIGAIGLILFLLATLSLLNAASVFAAAAVLTLLVIVDRARLTARPAWPRDWRPSAPTWFETVVIGLATGLVVFALLSAFIPENQSDAMRQHLPIAREMWQSQSAAAIAPMSTSTGPVQGHLFYAVAYGLGGVPAAKLVQVAIGLAAIAGVGAIAWLCAGRLAALVGATMFATMPIVLWELGHAFIDLFPVFFTVMAVLAIMLWQRDGFPVWLVYAGALAGLGFATKLNMAVVIAALAGVIILVGRAPWRARGRVLALVAFGIGGIVVVPWLIRGYGITGTLPGFGIMREQFSSVIPLLGEHGPSVSPALDESALQTAVAALQGPGAPGAGFGRSPFDLLGIPWYMTFHGRDFGFPIIGRGEIGIALLMLLPLALLGPRNRATAFLAVATVASYVGWWLTPYQIARHLLPTLALAAALAGIGVSAVVANAHGRPRQALAIAAQLGVIVSLVAVPFFFLPASRAQFPIDVILGRQSSVEYVDEVIRSAAVLAAASAELPADTLVGYVGGDWQGPQLYTEARLTYFASNAVGGTPEEVLATLDRLGVRYFIWNRADSDRGDWRSVLLSGSFLRDHTRILAGDQDAYLFEVLPGADHRWGTTDPANLLQDPNLLQVRAEESAWTTTGKTIVIGGVVALPRKGTLTQQVPVTAGRPYVLDASGRCIDSSGRVTLSIAWLDAQGNTLGTISEQVIPGQDTSDQFLWRRAPERATSASVQMIMSSGAGRCEFYTVKFYDLS